MNWVAVIAGAVAAFAAGFLIYGPMLFGRVWAEGTRVTPPASPPAGSLVWQGLAMLALAVVIGLTETQQDLVTAVVAILAVAAQAGAVGAWAQKSGTAIAVDVGYVLLGGVLMILAQGLL